MDIDKIFAASKKKAKADPKAAPRPPAAPSKPRIKKTKPAKKEDKTRATASKFTDDGFRIVREGDLRTGGTGDTKDCPFDCDCCF